MPVTRAMVLERAVPVPGWGEVLLDIASLIAAAPHARSPA